MRILLVEDDPMIARTLQRALAEDGYAVDRVGDGEAARLALDTAGDAYALVLLDLGLPRKSGLDLLRELRRGGNRVRVLIVTARDAVADRVAGLDAGADDYLTKPFSLDELTARMRALLRRDVAREDNLLRHGELTLDTATRIVMQGGRAIDVSAREFALLAALLERPGAALSKAQLEERIYRWGEEVESNAIEVHVHNLRKKLGVDAIRTLRGVGYALA
ncbi:MAG: response regulator [Betaproteobacteria bacterium]|nr:response regulator [Betaproteobacteria bacterium]MDE2004235.1 response regulator [Betaproteobacteria bacterium]MDE2208195.1 response regulator [Betaproteobacteria bacterium]